MLGTDLRDDHPIGIEYCGGGLTGTTANATPGVATGACKDSDFKQPFSGTINAQPGLVGRDRDDRQCPHPHRHDPLQPRIHGRQRDRRSSAPAATTRTCPQGQTGPNTQVAGATFLRVSNAGSAVCLACHIK